MMYILQAGFGSEAGLDPVVPGRRGVDWWRDDQ